MSNFEFCKVHFYYCYIMWKTYADLFKGEKVSTLCYLKALFIFLVFLLTFDRTIAIWGPFGNGLACKSKPITEQCFVFPSPIPRHLTKTKATMNIPFSVTFITRSSLPSPTHSDHSMTISKGEHHVACCRKVFGWFFLFFQLLFLGK